MDKALLQKSMQILEEHKKISPALLQRKLKLNLETATELFLETLILNKKNVKTYMQNYDYEKIYLDRLNACSNP